MPHDQPYLEAEKKIKQALKSGATELDLNDIGLTQLPPELWKLKNLKVLKLGYEYSGEKNQLKEIPKEIGQLTQLQTLNLSNNQLTALSDSLGQLTQLQSLNLSDNQLTTLPESLGGLTQLQSLNLSSNQLTTLPDSLGQLAQLQTLNLSSNQLTALPESLGQLTQLQTLNIFRNQLTALPASPLAQLTQLTELNLSDNQLTTLPDFLGQLTQLTKLDLSSNQLTTLPESLGQLTLLKTLGLDRNKFTTLPDWLGLLTQLDTLWLQDNRIEQLPSSLEKLSYLRRLDLGDGTGGNPLNNIPMVIHNLPRLEQIWVTSCKLKSIPEWLGNIPNLNYLVADNNQISNIPASLSSFNTISLDNNPLNPALQSAYDACSPGNYEPLKAYLRSLEQNAEPLYEAKLVLVGEGNVGKTTLLKALKGRKDEAPQKNEPTTHGVEIDIHGLRLPHPAKNGVEIQLNAWDFGGQDVYRVTHQFFFSRRSLYLLVWEPRRGVQQCQVEDWLNMIRLRVGDDARVIIVSTYSKSGDHIARIDKPVFKQQYGEIIVGFHEVDSLTLDETTGEMVGIAELKKIIAEQAAQLEHVGMLFSPQWKAARDELIAYPEPRISYAAFSEICAKHELSPIATKPWHKSCTTSVISSTTATMNACGMTWYCNRNG